MPVLDYTQSTTPEAPSPAYLRAVRHVRRAVVIWLCGGGLWLAAFLLLGCSKRLQDGQWPSMFEIQAAFFGIVLGLSLIGLWLAPLTVRWAFSLLHLPFRGRVPLHAWNDAAFDALWRLPWATFMAVILLLVYWMVEAAHGALGVVGGWPGDLIAGTFGNALGAWCYLPIFWRWSKLVLQSRQQTRPVMPPR